jgi:hypothetical protein
MVYNPMCKQPKIMLGKPNNIQKTKIWNKETVHLGQICNITEETT